MKRKTLEIAWIRGRGGSGGKRERSFSNIDGGKKKKEKRKEFSVEEEGGNGVPLVGLWKWQHTLVHTQFQGICTRWKDKLRGAIETGGGYYGRKGWRKG